MSVAITPDIRGLVFKSKGLFWTSSMALCIIGHSDKMVLIQSYGSTSKSTPKVHCPETTATSRRVTSVTQSTQRHLGIV